MATARTMPPAGPAARTDDAMPIDMMEDQMDPMEEMEPEGYRIVIEVSGRNDLRVGVEPLEIERIPEGDPTALPDLAAPLSNLKPVGTIREALTEALDIYRSQGDMEAMSLGDEAFDEGFGDVEEKRNGMEYRR